jgi:hypothetical protein
MLPNSAFPGALPRSREAALDLLDRLDEFNATGGAFLTFVEIPLEERIGEYRFAGASRSLAGAVRRAEEFARVMLLTDPNNPNRLLRSLLEDNADSGYDSGYSYPREAPVGVDVPHRLVLCIQNGAPYEGGNRRLRAGDPPVGRPRLRRPPAGDRFPGGVAGGGRRVGAGGRGRTIRPRTGCGRGGDPG